MDNRTLKRVVFKYSSAGVERWRVEDTYTVDNASSVDGSHTGEIREAFAATIDKCFSNFPCM
jgi:hypothetical protein